MITVRIPAEIRKYKEKLVAGLNARQILATAAGLITCVPLYFGGLHFGVNEELLSWLVLILGAVILSIGFVSYHGMPMEKFIVCIAKYMVYPSIRTVKTRNTYRVWLAEEKEKEKPKTKKERKQLAEYERQASLERAALLAEAEEAGEPLPDVETAELVTVTKPTFGGSGDKKPKDDDKKEKKKEKWVIQAEAIEAKMAAEPEYVPAPKERKLLLRLQEKRLQDRKKVLQEKKRQLDKESSNMKKRRSLDLRIPRSVADSIPIVAVYDEGIFEVSPNKYSKAYLLTDMNYKTAREEEQKEVLCRLRDFYNSFPEDTHVQLCVDNRVISLAERQEEIFCKMRGDLYDKHRKEHNRVLSKQMQAGHNNMRVEKYIVLTIDAAEPVEALLRFRKLDSEVSNSMRKIGVTARPVSSTERLAYFHDKFRPGHEGEFRIDYGFLKREGLCEKDYIAPPSFDFARAGDMQIGDDLCRVMFLTGFPGTLTDELLRNLYDVNFPVTVTFNIQPVDQRRGKELVNRQLTGIKKDKMEAEQRAIRNRYSPDNIRQDIKDGFEQATELHNDMEVNNQRLFFNYLTVMVFAKTRQELADNCAVVLSRAKNSQTELQVLNYQQEEGYKSTLPFGYVSKDLHIDRTMTSDSTAIFVPFTCTEIYEIGGFYYGLNSISRNLILLDRRKMKTGSGMVVGTSGSGKSFAVKREIVSVLLYEADADVIIIDPENEYHDFTRVFGGTTLKISPDSDLCLSPMDMPEDYGLDGDKELAENTPMPIKKIKAIKKKSGMLMAVVERMISTGGNGDESTITAQQKTLIDRCIHEVYKEYLDHDFDPEYLPTLRDLQDCLDAQKEESEVAWDVAEGMEYYTRGSMDVFAGKTNIDVKNRLICINIRDIGEQLRQIAYTIVFDFISNRSRKNKRDGIRTYTYCDEIHIMFRSYYSAEYFRTLYQQGRKWGMIVTGITQNVSLLLLTAQARAMIGNSDFVMMLNQHSEDMDVLAPMLGISEEQRRYVSGVDAGSGLLYAEGVVVPFEDKYPEDSYLYTLMSTKFGEDGDEDAEKRLQEILAAIN